MTALSRSALKALWVARFQPTSGNFSDLFDSYTTYQAGLESLGAALTAGGTGVAKFVSSSSAEIAPVSATGYALLSASSTTAARSALGAGAWGDIIFRASTTAAGQAQLGGRAVGIQLFACTTTADAASIISASVAAASPVPVGTLMPYAGATASAPTGWLMANGQAVSRTTYANLFTAIGEVYGAGDTSTTFNVPDLRGRTVFGHDAMASTTAGRITNAVSGFDGSALGAAGGAQSITLTTGEMPAHTHTGGIGAGSNTVTAPGCGSEDNGSTGSAGSGGAHRNVPPGIILNWIIKHSPL